MLRRAAILIVLQRGFTSAYWLELAAAFVLAYGCFAVLAYFMSLDEDDRVAGRAVLPAWRSRP